jgi:hypothetical protein
MSQSITLDEEIAAAERELAMRKAVYPGRIRAKKMTQAKAEHEIACMWNIAMRLRAARAEPDPQEEMAEDAAAKSAANENYDAIMEVRNKLASNHALCDGINDGASVIFKAASQASASPPELLVAMAHMISYIFEMNENHRPTFFTEEDWRDMLWKAFHTAVAIETSIEKLKAEGKIVDDGEQLRSALH